MEVVDELGETATQHYTPEIVATARNQDPTLTSWPTQTQLTHIE